MERQIIEQVKQAAKNTYCYILDVVGQDRQDFVKYRDMLTDTVEKSKDLANDLERIGLKRERLQSVIDNTDNQSKKNVFVAYMYIDWTEYCTFNDVNLYSLNKFFEDRPKLSPSSISEQAGYSAKYLRMILNEDRPLTESVIEKLKPILFLYGWGKRKEKD